MTEIIFYALMFSTFLTFSFGCITYSGVNRTFLLMNRGVFENALNTIGEDGEPDVYFSEAKVEENVNSYLEENLPKYVTSYEVSIFFIDKESDAICTEYCTAVKVSLKAQINYFFTYEKGLLFFASEGKIHE